MNVTLHIGGQPVTLENITRKPQEITFTLNGTAYTFRSRRLEGGSFLLEREVALGVWWRMSGMSSQVKDGRHVQLGAWEAKIAELVMGAAHAEVSHLSPRAPMPGLVRQVLVKPKQQVKQGDALAVMEAMKLQMTLTAGGDAMVDEVLVKEGEMIAEGAELVKLTALEKAA